MLYRIHFIIAILSVSIITACGGGGGGGGPSNSATVNISGKISYDYVPSTLNGLDYNATEERPARGITVNLLDRADAIIANTTTDVNGNYRFAIKTNTQVRVRAVAEITKSSPSYNFKVTDNTQNNSIYAIQGALISAGETDSSRDLHAESGWGGSNYTEERAAAPFAIIDTVYTSLQPLIVAAGQDLSMPAAELRWSTRNRPAGGNDADGNIGTSKFVPGESAIYILGSANNDTDEYDAHVVAHEFGHYVDFALSRSDSLGGKHAQEEELDMRVAFGEGYANAFSGIVLNDPIYLDSFGPKQQITQDINIAERDPDFPGWFNEASVQKIVYNLHNEDQDIFNDMYAALTSDSYKTATAFTSIHLFAATLKHVAPRLGSRIDELTGEQNIVVNDIWGSGEGNSGGLSATLPIYKPLVVGAGPVRLCSTKIGGEFNKLGNRQFARTTISSPGRYLIETERESGLPESDPDFLVFQRGDIRGGGTSNENNSEAETITLSSGEAVIEVYEFSNTDDEPLEAPQTGGTVCFNVSITRV